MEKLGILDYGIGGLDLYCRLKGLNPDLPITYFSDTGAIPYGKLDADTLTLRLQSVVNYLEANGVEHVVIACHSASTVAHRLTGLPITDMIAATKNTLKTAELVNNLGIIGGGRTIESGIYKAYAKELGMHVVDHNAQIFSIAIENDWTEQAEFNSHLNNVLKPLGKIDGLLLACTHYPLIATRLNAYYDGKLKILDPMEQMLKVNFSELTQGLFAKSGDLFLTTGNAVLMKRLASRLYGLKNLNVNPINL